MIEGLPHPAIEKKFPRRSILRLGAVGSGIVIYKLHQGISLAQPPVVPEEFNIRYDDVALWEQSHIDLSAYSDNTDRLINRPSEPIIEQKKLTYAHRAGNRIETINEAFKKGVQVFDMDLNKVGNTLYVDHGRVFRFGVIDIDEKKLKLGKPKYTFRNVAKHLGDLTSDNRKLYISAELKHGDYEERDVTEFFDTAEEFDLGAIARTRSHQQFEIANTAMRMRENNSLGTQFMEMHEGLEMVILRKNQVA